jgi:hypothetical protein
MAADRTGKMDRNNEIARRVDRNMVMTQTSVGYQPPPDDRSYVQRRNVFGAGTRSAVGFRRSVETDKDVSAGVLILTERPRSSHLDKYKKVEQRKSKVEQSGGASLTDVALTVSFDSS